MDLEGCHHRGTIHGDRAFCRSDKVPAKDRRGLVLLSVCEACPVAGVPNKVRPAVTVEGMPEEPSAVSQFTLGMPGEYDFPPCVYRGEKIEDKEADLCGMRGVIFEVRACHHYDVPGRCVATRICQRQEEMPCSTCERREMPDDLETVP